MGRFHTGIARTAGAPPAFVRGWQLSIIEKA